MHPRILFVSAFIVSCWLSPLAAQSPSPAEARVYFVSPKDGDHLATKLEVRFGLSGMGIAPAGIEMTNTGHHHLLVNASPAPDLNQPLPSSEMVRHFGKGQTEARLELAPGVYTLQLVLADHLHRPHQPPVLSEIITVTVEK
jgi:hypothetical protein